MLDYMRKNAGSWIIKIMLFGIVVVFAFWGVGPSGQDANVIMTIDKVKVPYNEYRDIYSDLLDSYRQVYDNLDSATLDFLDLKEQAKNTLIDKYLLLEAARKLDVSASPEEVAAQITSAEAFQENGIFMPQRYHMFLDVNRTTPEAYEASLAKDITISKVTDLVKVSAVITRQEVDDNLLLLTRQAAVKVLELTPSDFVRMVPAATEEEIEDYFEEHIELYRVPEKFRQAVTIIDPADFADKVIIATEDLEDWYEDMRPEFIVPAAYHTRHILFSLPDEASAESIQEVRTLAEDVVRQIREDEISFDTAANRYSDDRESALKGGDLGFLEERELDRAFRDEARDLDENEISDPIPTANGFEVISVVEYRDEHLKSFEEVRDELEQRLLQEQSIELAYDLADDLLDEIQSSGKPLADVAEEKGLVTDKTSPFSRNSALEILGFPRDILETAFGMEEEEVGDVYEGDGKLYLFQIIERNDPYLPELDSVRVDVEAGLLVQRAMDLALEKAKEMLSLLEAGHSLDSLAASLGKRAVKTEPFTIMDTTLPGLGDSEQIVQTAFAIREPGDGAVASGRLAHYIVVLEELVGPNEEELKEVRPAVEEALRAQREQDILSGYIMGLRKKMNDRIEFNEELL